ncbi:amidohydrolase family protein, partial [Steroidobacter sp.]|uniref:amidohydrolase family protein n=1 Tax=Steroidobacter sp. TaxID=1978227 RepID=UPI001A5F7136
ELLIRDGRIAAVGSRVDVPADAERIDVSGKRIYPGMISANSILGLPTAGMFEANQPPNSHFFQELGWNNANLRPDVAVDPDGLAWPVARANGVLTALIVPGVGPEGIIAGRSMLMKPDGWTAQQMTVAGPIALHVYWPDTSEKRTQLDQALREARTYLSAKLAGHVEVPDLRSEAMLPILDRRMPVFIHADRIAHIRAALEFARQERLRMVLVTQMSGSSDAWRVASTLKEQTIPVILGTAHTQPTYNSDDYDSAFTIAGKLAAAGVQLAIANRNSPYTLQGGVTAERNLPYQAATFAAYGLGAEGALRAITLTPAEILGVADHLGSLDAGKAATLFIASGDVLDIRSAVERAWIDGREVNLAANHHTRLYERYRKKYQGLPKE